LFSDPVLILLQNTVDFLLSSSHTKYWEKQHSLTGDMSVIHMNQWAS